MFEAYKDQVRLSIFRRSWRKSNQHNSIGPITIFDPKIVTVGKGSYGPLFVKAWGAENECLKIGNYCSIAAGVKFLLGGNHNISGLMTYPLRSKFKPKEGFVEASSKGPIIIEDDVWIGTDAIVLSGVTIGKGSVVAAGAVVVKDIEPYSIVGGNPCRLIKKRFNDFIIQKLIALDYIDIDFSRLTVPELEVLDRTIITEEDFEDVARIIEKLK